MVDDTANITWWRLAWSFFDRRASTIEHENVLGMASIFDRREMMTFVVTVSRSLMGTEDMAVAMRMDRYSASTYTLGLVASDVADMMGEELSSFIVFVDESSSPRNNCHKPTMPIPYISDTNTNDRQELAREVEYHARLLTEALGKPFMTIANGRIKYAIRMGKITLNEDGCDVVSGLPPDILAESYVADTCRRFATLFRELPATLSEANERVDAIKSYLSMQAPNGDVIPIDVINMLASLPDNYIFLPLPNKDDPRDILDKSILEAIDRYLAQQLRGAEYYKDDGSAAAPQSSDESDPEHVASLELPPPTMAMIMAVPKNLTKEEVVLALENVRNA